VAEEQELRTDARDPTDQPDHFRTEARPTPRLPAPEVAESLAMPAEDGLRPDDDEGRAPPVPDPCQAHPECPFGMTQPGSYNPAAEDGEPLPEGEIFQSQLRTVSEEGAEEQEDDSEDGHRVLPGRTLLAG